MKEKSRPATGVASASSLVAGELLVRRPTDKLLKQRGEGRIDPFSIIPKKDCWQLVETFLWPPEKGNAGWVKLGREFETG